MSAVPSFPPLATDRAAALSQLRADLVRRFPGAIQPATIARHARGADPHAALRSAPFLWVEIGLGQGGLAWLAAWTLLRLADDPLRRPALWIDTHSTLTPGDLLDLEGRLVVVRPADPHEAHVAADIALRSGSFSLVALEMHRALHPTPLGRLARLASARRGPCGLSSESSVQGHAHTPLVLWGEPPPFVAPPSGIARTSFVEAVSALVGDPRLVLPSEPHAHDPRFLEPTPDDALRTPHATDRMRPLDRAADRRASPPPPRALGADLVADRCDRDRDRDDDDAFPFTRARAR
jgi:hypothetical protein